MNLETSEPNTFFAGRTVVIATMHHKERAIAPLLERVLGVTHLVPSDFDTDHFGTFTRDIDRPADQLTTARLKAEAALVATGESLAIASEGSFGPHPQIPFVGCDREFVLLLDRQNQIEIVGEAVSTETNYRSQTIRTVEDALTFAQSVGFPTHGLIVMPTASNSPRGTITKGITTEAHLVESVRQTLAASASGTLHIETDMRALYNPTRMRVIAQATENLIRTIAQRCPQCGCPGFSPIQRRPGLPCGLCGSPTLLTLSVRYQCQRCQFQHDQPCPDSPPVADPMHCSYCNP